MSLRAVACLAIPLLVAGARVGSVAADELPIGYVKVVAGTASVHHGDKALPATLAMPLYQQDWLETGRDGAIGVTFRDNTRIAIGPNSRLEVARFVFAPAESQYGFIMRLVHGSLEYLSGLTAKLAPDSMSIETPGATLAVRGTHFLARTDD